MSDLARPEKHPKQDELDSIVAEKLDDVFAAIDARFMRLSRFQRDKGEQPLKPSEVKSMLRTWDLDYAFEDWWYDGKTEDDLDEDPWS